MKLLIIGTGGCGYFVKERAILNGHEKADFFDDNSLLVGGKVSDLEKIENRYDGSFVAIGNPEIKEKILED